MKRSYLSILLILCTLLAQARQPIADITQVTTSHFQVADTRMPHTEIEVAMTGHAGMAIYPAFKKIIGIIPVVAAVPQRGIIYNASVQPVLSCEYSKNYLRHIYPSLHFW